VQSNLAARCDAAATIAGRVAFWSVLAEDDRRRLTVAVDPGPLPVPVSASDLADVLDVLIDNVFAHTPDGTAFAVSLRAGDRTCVLTVADEGGGWAAETKPGPGHTGLGLDIARRTAADCGGRMVTGTTPHGGAKVEVALPLLP
jgi:signal transduction histidine kinase